MKAKDIHVGGKYAVSSFRDYDGYALRATVVSVKDGRVGAYVSVYDEVDGVMVTEHRSYRLQDVRENWDDYAARA